jgi:hypothetical protein
MVEGGQGVGREAGVNARFRPDSAQPQIPSRPR